MRESGKSGAVFHAVQGQAAPLVQRPKRDHARDLTEDPERALPSEADYANAGVLEVTGQLREGMQGNTEAKSAKRREVKYEIPRGTRKSTCRGCEATIYWIRTPAGKQMPVDPDGTPHFATCPQAYQFSRKSSGARAGKEKV